jgi:tetratricopeptide (TPR) repeat protein
LKHRQGDSAEALASFQKLASANAAAKNNAALLYYNGRDYSKAYQIREEILSENPEGREAKLNIGLIYESLLKELKFGLMCQVK